MPRLFRDDEPIALVEVARTHAQRRRGLLGRTSLPEVLVMSATSVHTIGLGRAIDVAFCRVEAARSSPLIPAPAARWFDRLPVSLHVAAVTTMVPGRVSRPRWGERIVLEAPCGSWRRLGVSVGDRLELR